MANWQGLLAGAGNFANGVSGLLFPGYNAAGVDPNAVRAARAQAMMQMGAGLLGGANAGQAYGAGLQAGFEPMEQYRRNAELQADAELRRQQAEQYQWQRQRQQQADDEAAKLRAAISGVQFDPANPQAYAIELARRGASVSPSFALDAAQTAAQFAPKERAPLTLSRGEIAIDPKTGQELARGLPPEQSQGAQGSWTVFDGTDANGKPAKFRMHSITGEVQPISGVTPKQEPDREKQKLEVQLSNSFQQQSQTHATVASQYRRMLDLSRNPSAANDMALIYAFAKINDPNSVVRESEFQSAAKVGTYGQALQVAANKLSNGEMLTPEQRQQFLAAAGSQYRSSNTQWVNSVVLPYQKQAESYGLNWGNIYKDYRVKETPSNGPQTFATEADAEAAAKSGRLMKGQRVVIGGVSGTWQ